MTAIVIAALSVAYSAIGVFVTVWGARRGYVDPASSLEPVGTILACVFLWPFTCLYCAVLFLSEVLDDADARRAKEAKEAAAKKKAEDDLLKKEGIPTEVEA